MKRDTFFEGYQQLMLGELIEKIKACGLTYGEENLPKTMMFDFGSAVPTCLNSSRGDYSELALGYRLDGYDRHFKENDAKPSLATDLLSDLESAIGSTFEGYKGGEYKMTKDTPVWVDNWGNCSNTAIVDVIDGGYYILLITAYCEY